MNGYNAIDLAHEPDPEPDPKTLPWSSLTDQEKRDRLARDIKANQDDVIDDYLTLAAYREKSEKGRPDLDQVLQDCYEFCDNQQDVIDGDYGIPEPNRAMQLVTQIRAVMCRHLGADPEGYWRPIETAPKDGTEILVCNALTGEIRVGVQKLFNEKRYEWFRSDEFCPGHTWSIDATHWMPKPLAPEGL